MSGLFESLSSAANALTAHRMGLDVVGQNLANVNTAGYTRRTLDLAELPPTDGLSAGRGVEVRGIRALRDELVEARLRREQQGTAFDEAVIQTLSMAEAMVGLPGASLDSHLTAFFDAWSALASDPTSIVARDGVVHQSAALARAFRDLSGQFVTAQQDADAAIRDSVAEMNRLAAELAEINGHLDRNLADVDAMKDRQTVLLGRLSKLADIAVLPRADGLVDVTLSNGRALVIGEHQYALQTSAGGFASISLEGVDVTASFTGGRIGGSLEVRDTTIPAYLARLDQLAYDLATAVNTAHAAGFDANGAAAGALFAPLAGVSGAAAGLTVASAVAADSRLVAASATGAIGDNQTARALSALRDGAIVAGSTMTPFEAWSELVYTVGSDMAGARVAQASHADLVKQLQQLRDRASGVSYDEEAAHLMRYQRAYEASARYFTTISDTLDILMGMVR